MSTAAMTSRFCEVTGNPCGTDTVHNDALPCGCDSCRRWYSEELGRRWRDFDAMRAERDAALLAKQDLERRLEAYRDWNNAVRGLVCDSGEVTVSADVAREWDAIVELYRHLDDPFPESVVYDEEEPPASPTSRTAEGGK